MRLPILLLAPLVLFAYPALAGWLAPSEIPLVLGRYSVAFFIFNLWNLGLFAVTLSAWFRGRHTLLQLGYLLLILTTVAVPMNNQLQGLFALTWLLPLTRLAAAVAALFAGFDRHRRGLGASHGGLLGLAALFIILSLLDFVLLAILAVAPEQRRPDAGLREEYELSRVGAADIVLVGDSFVWGQGVALDERFGNRLESLRREREPAARVYSLGLTGIGATRYLELLAELPESVRATRVIVAFYMNDMPPPDTLRSRVQNASTALGRGFPTIRLLGDKLAKLLAVDVHAYHRSIVDSYRQDHETFPARWAILERQLEQIHAIAASRAEKPPLLLMLPIMVDFVGYPLDNEHRRIAELARGQGYEVLDLLTVFRAELGDGDAHRAAPDDNHFDAATHALVARVLDSWLAEAP